MRLADFSLGVGRSTMRGLRERKGAAMAGGAAGPRRAIENCGRAACSTNVDGLPASSSISRCELLSVASAANPVGPTVKRPARNPRMIRKRCDRNRCIPWSMPRQD